MVIVCLLLFYLEVYEILLDFLRFDFSGLDDYVVGLLFNFLDSFFRISFW